MKGLAEAVASEESTLVHDRMLIMDMCRSSLRVIPIDADDEDWERQQTPMTGMPDMLDRLMLRLSAASGIPVSILFGQGPTGLDNTAEGDIEIWGSTVESKQETELRDPLERIVELLLKSKDGPTAGKEPDGWSLLFNPLRQMTEQQTVDLRSKQAETDERYILASVLSENEVRQSRFAGEQYSIETQLDESELEDPDAMVAAAIEMERANTTQPGATIAGSEKTPVVVPTEALNGAQVSALIDLATKVAARELGLESALAIMTTAFPIDEERARRILANPEIELPTRPVTGQNDDDGVCDPDSPDYDPAKCAERRA